MRLDMGYFPRKNKVSREEVIIREESREEHHKVEMEMIMDSKEMK